MKIKLGFNKYVEEDFELPKKFEIILTKDENDYTDEEWDLNEEFNDWLHSITGDPYCTEDVEIISF